MGKWLRSFMSVGFILFTGLIVAGYLFKWSWTGFPERTLWDWLSVLAVPVVVGFGVAWFTTHQTSARESAVEQQRKTELEIANNNRHEAALQTYIDKMSELLLENNLRASPADAEVRTIARVRTLTVLRMLDPIRKGIVLEFLYDIGAIYKGKSIVSLRDADLNDAYLEAVSLKHADLSEANLKHADLRYSILKNSCLKHANLEHADLESADLDGADLQSTYLTHAYLGDAGLRSASLKNAFLAKAFLSDADLSDADLSGANVSEKQLNDAKSLRGATMPDGSKHP